MKDPYTITIKLKPYAREYMIYVYGDPVNLYHTGMNDLHNKIKHYLERPRYDRESACKMKGYIETRFVISQRDFYRLGHHITNTDNVQINEWIQDHIKELSKNFIIFRMTLGIPINKAIREFQDKYNLQEVMSCNLIYKSFRRYCKANPKYSVLN